MTNRPWMHRKSNPDGAAPFMQGTGEEPGRRGLELGNRGSRPAEPRTQQAKARRRSRARGADSASQGESTQQVKASRPSDPRQAHATSERAGVPCDLLLIGSVKMPQTRCAAVAQASPMPAGLHALIQNGDDAFCAELWRWLSSPHALHLQWLSVLDKYLMADASRLCRFRTAHRHAA